MKINSQILQNEITTKERFSYFATNCYPILAVGLGVDVNHRYLNSRLLSVQANKLFLSSGILHDWTLCSSGCGLKIRHIFMM